MSGHSKWTQIKRQKAVTDAKRSKEFTRLLRLISIAVQEGGNDISMNAKLRMVVDRALAANMPKENIDRAVERAHLKKQGKGSVLEAYGPGGSAYLIEVVTDNNNRTLAEVRHLLSEYGGTLAQPGSVAWQFERCGELVVQQPDNPETVELAAIDAGALDVRKSGADIIVITAPQDLKAVEKKLEEQGIQSHESRLLSVPQQPLDMADDLYTQNAELHQALEEYPDVIEITSNVIRHNGN